LRPNVLKSDNILMKINSVPEMKVETKDNGFGGEVILTVVIVNFNSVEFILESLRAIERLTVSKWKMVICDNGSSHDDFVRLRNGVSRYQNVTLLARTQTEFGSYGHGEALNVLARHIDTRYGAILDADCLPLMFGWDSFLISKLDGEVKIAGTPVAHNTPGDSKRDRSFPLMFLCLFDAEAVRIDDIDFRPRSITAGEDTGWRMRETIEKQGYKGFCLVGQNTRTYRQGPLAATICDEYYTDASCERLICAHFGRGSNPRSGKYKTGAVSHADDKGKWLDACASIIDREIEVAIRSGRLALDYNACPSCGSEESDKEFIAPDWLFNTPGFWNVVKCRTCGLRRTNPHPKMEAIGEYYPDNYGPYQVSAAGGSSGGGIRARLREQTLRQHFGYFRERFPASLLWRLITKPFVRMFRVNLLPILSEDFQHRKLLEIGCSHGERLAYLKHLGWEVQGVEFSELAAEKARARGIDCKIARIEDCDFQDATYDAVIMSMVLEHLADPVATLTRVAEWLRPGGTLLLSVPNFDGVEARLFGQYAYTLQVPTHLTHFDPRTLTALLVKTGFSDVRILSQGFHRDLKAGLQTYLLDHPHSPGRHLLHAPQIFFRLAGILFGRLGISSRISVSAIRSVRNETS